MNRLHHRVETVFRALIFLLGFYALYLHICLVGQASFISIRSFSFLPIFVSILFFWKCNRLALLPTVTFNNAPQNHQQPISRSLLYFCFGAPVLIAVLYAITKSDWLFWLLAVGYLIAVSCVGKMGNNGAEPLKPSETRFEIAILLFLCLVAGLLTAGSNVPNRDDAYYVNIAASMLEFPEAAPQSFDAMLRTGLPPVEQALHLPQTYEVMVGIIADLTGIPVQVFYYLILPPLWAVLSILANWLVLRYFLIPRGAIWGTTIFTYILIFWGDGHRAFGNFAFVRLFQGKSVYLLMVLPLIILAALRYRRQPNLSNWLSLALAQLTALGFTTNGLIVAPLAAALVIIANPKMKVRSIRMMLVGFAASMPLGIAAVGMYLRVAPYLRALDVDAILPGYSTTLGSAHAPMILLAFMLLPALAFYTRNRLAGWIAGHVFWVTIVVLLPATSSIATQVLGNAYSWRLFWAVPMPFFVSLAGGMIAGVTNTKPWLFKVGMIAWLALFALLGSPAINPANLSVQNIVQLKVDKEKYDVAQKTVMLAQPGVLALLPETIAIYITGFQHTPPLVGVRLMYLSKLRGVVPENDLAKRITLFRYITNISSENDQTEQRSWLRNINNYGAEMSAGDALNAIDEKAIGTVVFSASHRDAGLLTSSLEKRGFAVHLLNKYVIATCAKKSQLQKSR